MMYSDVAAKMEFCGSSVSIVELSPPSGPGWFVDEDAAVPLGDDREDGCRPCCARLAAEEASMAAPPWLLLPGGGDSSEPSAAEKPDRFRT
jgi:hypothetical protein